MYAYLNEVARGYKLPTLELFSDFSSLHIEVRYTGNFEQFTIIIHKTSLL